MQNSIVVIFAYELYIFGKVRIRNIITLLLLSLLATACNTDKGDAEGVVPTPVELVIRASQGVTTRASVVEDPEIVVGADLATADLAADPVAPDTRTELGTATDSELPIHWSGPVKSDVPGEDKPGDQIMVWAKPNSDATVGYAFEQTVFSLAHFNYTYSSADFTAVVADKMDKDYTYTYNAIYPSPRSRKLSGSSYTESAVDGITMNTDGTVTYSLPTTQTGDYNGAYDIMRGTATGAALNDSSDADNSIWPQPELRMQHLMHLMRIRVPADRNLMGRSIKRLEITFPQEIVGGTVTFDPTDPTAAPTWSGQSAKVTIDFDDTNLLDAAGRDVWIFVKPGKIEGEISFQAYDTAGVPAAAISTTVDKTLQSQHITPIALTIPSSLYPVTYLKITETANNLGEAWWTMTLSGLNFPKPFTLEYDTQKVISPNENGVYEVAVAASASDLKGKQVALKYESEHTLFDDPITLPSNISGTSVNVNKVVPYLLEEDFSQAKSYEKNDDYNYNNDETTTGYLLNGYMPDNGWNASRFSISGGNSMRINVRYESGAYVVGRYCGRLDTPALSKLKDDANATIKVQFDMGCYVRLGRDGLFNGQDKLDDTKNAVTSCVAGTHTNSQNSKIDGQNQNDVAGQMTSAYTSPYYVSQYGENSFGSTFPTSSFTASGAGKTTRVVWWANTTRADSKVAANCNYYLYIDNIKVSIAQ